MSNQFNEVLLERAKELMEAYTGTMWEKILQRDIDASDMEALQYHVREATAELQMENEADLLGANDVF